MEVKINIEPGQIGDTAIELFKNLTPEKKEDLALEILREWLLDPCFLETRNRETLLVEEFRSGARRPQWGEKFNSETPEQQIKRDSNYQKALSEYKTSKQILVEDIKVEVIGYYKKYIAEEIMQSEIINKAKEEAMQEVANLFPSIISEVLVQVFSNELGVLKDRIHQTYIQNDMNTNMIKVLRNNFKL